VETKAVDNVVVLPAPPLTVAAPAPVVAGPPPVAAVPPASAPHAVAPAAHAVAVAAHAVAPASQAVAPAPHAVAVAAHAVAPAPHAAASILAITEDPELRDTLLEMALAEGFGVRCAATEADAAALIHAERPGLVLIDLDIPIRTGVKFLRTLRASPYRDIPCLAVTASNDPMLTVSLDAPVFFKPSLDGLDATLERLFAPG
jgi:CheY-like chemotaxis protein